MFGRLSVYTLPHHPGDSTQVNNTKIIDSGFAVIAVALMEDGKTVLTYAV